MPKMLVVIFISLTTNLGHAIENNLSNGFKSSVTKSSDTIITQDKFKIALEYMQNGEYINCIKLLNELADKNDRDAQYLLGLAYSEGLNEYIKKDNQKAMKWLLLAAQDDKRSLGREGSSQNNAAFALGNLFLEIKVGDGIIYDPNEAAKWFKFAANRGHKGSQYNLGHLYYEGFKGVLGREGIQKNRSESVKWWKMSAAQGCVDSQFMIGEAYFIIEAVDGIVQDYNEAVKWFDIAAQNGDMDAQMHLGYMYYHGIGVEKNLLMAHQLFSLSATQGHKSAITYKNLSESELMKLRGNIPELSNENELKDFNEENETLELS